MFGHIMKTGETLSIEDKRFLLEYNSYFTASFGDGIHYFRNLFLTFEDGKDSLRAKSGLHAERPCLKRYQRAHIVAIKNDQIAFVYFPFLYQQILPENKAN